MESADGLAVGVQWHPEVDAHEVPHQQALFDWVVERARSRQSGSRQSG
jgi:gamma-glutamyl-gamma-aminobutyrate hydrolase PuuD